MSTQRRPSAPLRGSLHIRRSTGSTKTVRPDAGSGAPAVFERLRRHGLPVQAWPLPTVAVLPVAQSKPPDAPPAGALRDEPAAPEAQAAPARASGGKMGERLVQAGLLTPEQVERAIALQQSAGIRFGEAAVSLGFLTERDIQSALSEQFNYANALAAHPGLDPSLAIAHEPFGREAEAIRQVRAEISLRLAGRLNFSLAVVSPNDGEGKSYLAASLAIAYSQSGQRVLLVNANLRGTTGKRLFTLDAAPGLSTMLAGRDAPAPGVAVPGFPLLHVLDAGPQPPNPTEILGSPALRRFLDPMRREFDVIIVDTPAANRSADAQIIASQTDVCLLVARQDTTLLEDFLQTQERMRRAGAQLVGAVYNGHDEKRPSGQRIAKWRKWLGLR